MVLWQKYALLHVLGKLSGSKKFYNKNELPKHLKFNVSCRETDHNYVRHALLQPVNWNAIKTKFK
jgi:hypothetical protein